MRKPTQSRRTKPGKEKSAAADGRANVASATDAGMRLAAIVESSFEAIVSTSFDDTILSWNAAAERMFGYTAAEAVGRSVAMLRPPERAHEGPLLDESFERGNFPLQMETVRVRKNGEKIDVRLSVSPIKDTAGRTIGAAVLYEDITARKQAEDSLRQLSTLLLRLQDEERRRVARDLQDSISPVLTGLIGKLYALRKRTLELDAVSHRLLEESLTLAEHAASVTVGVSSVLYPPLLEAHGLSASLKWYLESLSKRSGIHVEMDLPSLLEPLPEGAALGLFRIVEDSLTRVLRPLSDSTVSVRLENGNQQLTLEISDEAPNSAPETRMDDGAAEFAIPVMRHRMAELGGQLDIKSEGARTLITASLPLTGNYAGSHNSVTTAL